MRADYFLCHVSLSLPNAHQTVNISHVQIIINAVPGKFFPKLNHATTLGNTSRWINILYRDMGCSFVLEEE